MGIKDRLFAEDPGTPDGGGQGTLFDDKGKAADAGAAKPAADPRVDAVLGRQAQLEAQLAQMTANLRPAASAGNPNDVRRQVNEQLWEALQNNPSQLLDSQRAIAVQAVQAYAQQDRMGRFQTDRMLAMNSVKEEGDNGEVFKRYKPEIESYISSMWANNPEAFVNADVWRTATDAIRGRHAKDLYSATSSSMDPGAPGKPSNKPMAASKSKDDEPLSEAEIFAAEQVFGIDKATYSKHKRIDKEQRDSKTYSGRAILQSPLAKMTYKDMNKMVGGFPNPHYGKMRPFMTFDSQVQKPRHARDGE